MKISVRKFTHYLLQDSAEGFFLFFRESFRNGIAERFRDLQASTRGIPPRMGKHDADRPAVGRRHATFHKPFALGGFVIKT